MVHKAEIMQQTQVNVRRANDCRSNTQILAQALELLMDFPILGLHAPQPMR